MPIGSFTNHQLCFRQLRCAANQLDIKTKRVYSSRFWLPNGKHRWFADRKQSTIWNFDKPKRSKEHPTMKPIPLLAYPIKNSSAPNNIVLDLFGGSGSTLMACEQTDRICRTMELDPKYATAIVMRYANEYGTENIRLLRNGEKLPYDAVAPQNSEHE